MPGHPENIVIVGATSAIAEHCARLWLQHDVTRLVLVGRDEARTGRLAADLRVRNPKTSIQVLCGGFDAPSDIARLMQAVIGPGIPDTVLIAHGFLPDQQACQGDLQAARDALHLNGISAVLFAEAFAGPMAASGGTLAVLGSVAGDRGRKSNYVYGAAKGLVERYLQGLQHRFAGTALNVVLIKPGPTDTPMTAHLKAQGARLADVASVAHTIVQQMQLGKQVIYAPARWALIMMVIRHLPRFVFNRMDI
jgi:decaprenylphospho-beta-D-erythro-pentofuranosid-2-ulose 2-reductase